MIDFQRTLYEIWWVSNTDEEDCEAIYEDLWSLDMAREKLHDVQQSNVEVDGRYCIVEVVSSYEELR